MVFLINEFSQASSFLQGQGYLLFFLLMIIEGPIVNAAGGFLASLGFFNVWIILILAVFADTVADLGFYFMGFYGKKALIRKFKNKLSSKKIESINEHLSKNSSKTITAIKLSPLLAGPGLAMVGASKISFYKFIIVGTIVNILIGLFFTFIGYYFGYAFDKIVSYFNLASGLIALIILLSIFIPFISRYLLKKVSKTVEEI